VEHEFPLNTSRLERNRDLKNSAQDTGSTGANAASSLPSEDGTASLHPVVERVWAWLHDIFPERQIYIRSSGRVQFLTFSPSLQATLAGLAAIFLGWVAFASVNVIFKDHIIAAKDHRFQAMQSAYEGRVADLQLSYDELNGALLAAEDRFKSTADKLEGKQKSIAGLLSRKGAIDASLAGLRNSTAAPPKAESGSSDFVGAYTPVPQADGDAVLPVLPAPAQPQPRTARPTHASLLDIGSSLYRLAVAWFQPQKAAVSEKIANHPALHALDAQTARLAKLNAQGDKLLRAANTNIAERARNIEDVMRVAGVSPTKMEGRYLRGTAMGGPLLPLSAVRTGDTRDGRFSADLVMAQASLSRLEALLAVVRHIPLAQPIQGAGTEITSGFGARTDPFTRRAAFHAGLDFGGPWGTKVHATAPGKVVWAGPRGAYGNMVEIDNGLGVRTRYGHLSRVLVRRGETIAKGQTVGRLGSTGRSTGPHVHYEVWVDNTVRNPENFLEAGRHVLE